ncbi:hypothetical protein [Nonlabens marinus]|uniref:Uncharacterized protein n=1 Tax=Nonlabens marinus S1-08 TaxID=1454201 RepID=W8VPK5_9FLAO|nr:hypothetical protein [Nonlabens marinus]BAO55099.1 hypothetical protein NMS_1090 [Nonlabens marinus S1-08]
MKKTLWSMLAISIALIACNDNKKKDNLTVSEYETEQEVIDEEVDAVVVVTREEAETMANDMRENVVLDENNQVSIKSFKAYGQLQNQVRNLSVKPNTREVMSGKEAYQAFEYFVGEMPAYLKTNLVMKEVADVRMAMNKLNADLKDNTTSEATIKRHISKVKEAVEDLNNEIVDVRLSLETDNTIDFDAYRSFVDNVNYDDQGYITIINFEEYGQVQNDWEALITAATADKDTYEQSLRNSFNNMVARMPAYLKIDDVMDAVADVRKELKEYEAEKAQADVDLDEQLENLEEIDEALYDLNKELLKSRRKYDDRKNDAIEEFMEEFNSNSNQTMKERLRDATEEYNEEMQK